MGVSTVKQYVHMRTNMPARKVQAGGVSGAITVVLVWSLNTFILKPDQQITAEIASALTAIASFIVSYLVSPSSEDGCIIEEISPGG